jgi:hypothetical protein
MTSLDFALRFLLTIGLLAGLGIWFYIYHKFKQYRNYTISPMFFSIHALIFSIIAGFNLIPKNIYLIWGDLVSIHGVIILISTGAVLIKYIGGRK